MEISQCDLEVAHILLELPQIIIQSESLKRKSLPFPSDWPIKRRRSSPSTTIPPIPIPMFAPPLPPLQSSSHNKTTVVSSLSDNNCLQRTRRDELREVLTRVSQQKEVVSKGLADAMRYYEQRKLLVLKLEESERELKLGNGMADAVRYYERVKQFALQLEEEERKLKLCLEQEELNLNSVSKHPIIYHHPPLLIDQVASAAEPSNESQFLTAQEVPFSSSSKLDFLPDLNLPPN